MAGRGLLFAVNGERFELPAADPSMTLLEFLRTRAGYTGAKLGCGEGGCGACVILLSKYNPKLDEVTEFTVSSCLTLLCSIHLCSVTTTEGLGNTRDGFHSIHQRFSGFHASQCGFCTPGMCMSLYSALENANKSRGPKPLDGFSKITVVEAEKAISGNLCRCTGYRPIADVCKSFAADVDLEDLGLNVFWMKGDKECSVKKLPPYRIYGVCTFPDFLKSEINSRLAFSIDGWYRPNSIDELYRMLNLDDLSKSSFKMVVGNTGSSFYKEHDLYDKYIDLRGISELSNIQVDSKGIRIGAAVTISKTIEVLRGEYEGLFPPSMRMVFTKLADHMDKVASHFVRNTASLGGNLIMASRNQFPSDIATILLSVGSSVCIQTPSERLVLSMEEFLTRPFHDQWTLLLSIYIPCRSSSKTSYFNTNDNVDVGDVGECVLLFETYRAAPRPLGNALAYLNAAFLAEVFFDKILGVVVLADLCLAFGSYGNSHAIRAREVEEFLVGKSVTEAVLLEAIKLLEETIVPVEGTTHSKYRSSLAVAFLFKFLEPLLESPNGHGKYALKNKHSESLDGCSDKNNGSLTLKVSKEKNLSQLDNSRLLLFSKQVVDYSGDFYPVGQPTKKVGAEIQASGEAVYVDDIPCPKDCLYGAFFYSKKPLAHIESLYVSPALASQKIITIISSDAIPKGGRNIGGASMFGSEPLFADSLAEYAGQPIGLVIAETQRFANMAAKQVTVKYSTEGLEPPISSVEEAVTRSSFFEIPAFICPKEVGDFSKGIKEADHKLTSEVKLGSQYYFYMETQTALAIPDEDNCIVVYSSCQTPEYSQRVIAKCLGIPEHNVRVITRRVGGGFGGKAIRAMPAATACALAAYKLRRPVRIYVDRNTDMVITGGRHPMKVNYSVGYKSDGKITALHIDLLINAGISVDISPIMPHNVIGALKKYNWGALSFNVKVCRTNLSSKSAMRAPGEVQGSYIAEAIIEDVASALLVDANSIREKNLHTFDSLSLFYKGIAGEHSEYTLPLIFDKLNRSSSFVDRFARMNHFNNCNPWRKRGISCIPVIHPVMVRPTPGKVSILSDGSIAVEVGGIELGQGIWTKVKQMAAYALGQLWADGSQELLDKVRVIQADTLSLNQGGFTAGSTTSESSCEAVRVACNDLVNRLKPLKDRLEEQMGSVDWDTLISQAGFQSVNLSASTYWVPDLSSMSYLNYGAALSEVEVDLLTGATKILRTDIIYDCGQSLNPAVDLGQIEGAFVQGIGFFMNEEYSTNSDGLVVSDGTWSYKIPTVDTIPREFNVEILNSGHHQQRVLSSKASGEPPLLLSASVHCATKDAIKSARAQLCSWTGDKSLPLNFKLDVPATMPVVKELCGLDLVKRYLEQVASHQSSPETLPIST